MMISTRNGTNHVLTAHHVINHWIPLQSVIMRERFIVKVSVNWNISQLTRSNFIAGCYGKQFGPKGVGFGLGAGILTT